MLKKKICFGNKIVTFKFQSYFMDQDYETIASEIIALHKSDPGHLLDWTSIFIKHIDDDIYLRKTISVRKMLLEKEMIMEEESKVITWLTEKGNEWRGFEKERQEAAKKEKLEKAKSWPQRHWIVFPFITSLIGLAFGITGEAIKKRLWPEQKLSIVDSAVTLPKSNKSKPYLYDSIKLHKTRGS